MNESAFDPATDSSGVDADANSSSTSSESSILAIRILILQIRVWHSSYMSGIRSLEWRHVYVDRFSSIEVSPLLK